MLININKPVTNNLNENLIIDIKVKGLEALSRITDSLYIFNYG